MFVGVLALQGDFREHSLIVQKLGFKTIEVRTKSDLKQCSGLIIPGGESTTLSLLMKKYSLISLVKTMVKQGMPVFGTCAGAILLAKKVDKKQGLLALIDMEIRRNAYGSQIDSFETDLKFNGTIVHGVFIRAPVIEKVSKNVKILAEFEEKPVLVEQLNLMASTFHPELTQNTRVHELFLKKVKEFEKKVKIEKSKEKTKNEKLKRAKKVEKSEKKKVKE